MDDLVLRGMARWPDVPAVFGWLSLDRRGTWRLKQERIANPALIGFIARNYAADEHGQWYFQNGPQRVYVTLEYAPFVYRIIPGRRIGIRTHHGIDVHAIDGAWMDESGNVVLSTASGAGIVHDGDMHALADALVTRSGDALDEAETDERIGALQHGRSADLSLAVCGAVHAIEPIQSSEVPSRFGFVREPRSSGTHS